ncbi:MAG: AsmA family protein, partial [Wohlfahrtiimonas sp.]
MKKLIKIFVYLVLTVVVVIALAIGGIVMFVNPNQFKPQITELVQKNANVILTIDGDIEWTFYPWLGLKVQN